LGSFISLSDLVGCYYIACNDFRKGIDKASVQFAARDQQRYGTTPRGFGRDPYRCMRDRWRIGPLDATYIYVN
jgi:hypothetical protein